MELKVKRVYDDPAPADGFRVLVDRLWPRGLSKERADLDLWAKDVAPSAELRTTLEPHAVVTLLYGTHDTAHNHAQLLAEALEA